MVNQMVKIDNAEYPGVSSVDTTLSARVPTQTTDEGFPVTDDIILNPPTFRLTMTLFDRWSMDNSKIESTRQEQYETLRDLWIKKKVFRFESDFGVFDDVVMSSFAPTEDSKSSSAYAVSLSLKVIVIARLLPAVFNFLFDYDGSVIGVTPTDSLLTEVPLTKPDATLTEDPSLLEELIGWFNGWWPWSD